MFQQRLLRAHNRVAISLTAFPSGMRFVMGVLWVLGIAFVVMFLTTFLTESANVLECVFVIAGLLCSIVVNSCVTKSYELDGLTLADLEDDKHDDEG